MTATGEEAVARLRSHDVQHAPGMSDAEIEAVEDRWGFRFADDHRYLLSQLVPVGKPWIDWRDDAPDEIASRLAWPLDGMLFDVEHNAFWPTEWGQKPADPNAAQEIARHEFERWTKLVPVFAHRYMPAAAPEGAPVFSVYQTDVIIYGSNLATYISREIAGIEAWNEPPTEGFEPWLRVADGWGEINSGE